MQSMFALYAFLRFMQKDEKQHQDTCWAVEAPRHTDASGMICVVADRLGVAYAFVHSPLGRHDLMYTYCLFCETVKCSTIARRAGQMFDCRAISPKRVQHTWDKGKRIDRINDLLPGYIFLYSDTKLTDISALRTVDGYIRCLKGSEDGLELTDGDEQFAMMLLQQGGVIGKTKVYKEGQRIHVCKGAFEGVHAEIVKVDHRNGRMLIEIPFAKRVVRTWVEYEIVESDEPEQGNCTSEE